MKVLVLGGLAVLGAVLLYVFAAPKPADVYEMPVAQAYGLLANVKYEPVDDDDRTERTISGNGRDKVTWASRSSHAAQSCDLALAPFEGDAGRTHVTVTCTGGGGPSDGAAAGMVHNMRRNAVIERVDATLTGRPYDVARAGDTAYRWPGDGVDGSLGTAIKESLEMQRDMQKLQADMRNRTREGSSYEGGGYADSTPQ